MDPLHSLLRMMVQEAYKTTRGHEAFKGIQIGPEITKYYSADDIRRIIEGIFSCGDMSNRLCEVLTGNSMSDIMTSDQAVELSDRDRVNRVLRRARNTGGYVLARINLIGGGLGHAYVWVSMRREAGARLEGRIYQTNIAQGLKDNQHFGLLDWVNDERSTQSVDLERHVSKLQENLLGGGIMKGAQAIGFYEDTYLPSGQHLPVKAKRQVAQTASSGQVRARVRCAPVDWGVVFANLRDIAFASQN